MKQLPTPSTPASLSMRALLRDTALRVAMLAQGAQADDIDALRSDCRALIAAFEAALMRHQVSAEMLREAVYAQCGLLDETVLRHATEALRSTWDAEPLQVERFQNHDAGERVFEAIAAQLHASTPNLALLECYSTILGLGFKGRYARAGEAERVALIAALDARIASLRTLPEPGVIIDTSSGLRWSRLFRFSPWVLALLSTVAAILLYRYLDHRLDQQLVPLLQQFP